MKRRVTRAASAFILATTLLAGCGQPADQSSFGPSAVQTAQAARSAVQAGHSAAQAVTGAKKGATEGAALSWWPQPERLLESARSAAAPPKSVADWWRGVFNKIASNHQGLAGGGKVLETRPRPR